MRSFLRVFPPFPSPLHRIGLIALLMWSVGSLGAGTDEPKKGKAEEESKHPKLTLVATPSSGFAPVEVTLDAALDGVDPKDRNFCHPSVTWTRIDTAYGPDAGSRQTEDPTCVHDEDEFEVVTRYSRYVRLSTPGTYVYQISIKAKDGTIIRSNYAKVRVLRVR